MGTGAVKRTNDKHVTRKVQYSLGILMQQTRFIPVGRITSCYWPHDQITESEPNQTDDSVNESFRKVQFHYKMTPTDCYIKCCTFLVMCVSFLHCSSSSPHPLSLHRPQWPGYSLTGRRSHASEYNSQICVYLWQVEVCLQGCSVHDVFSCRCRPLGKFYLICVGALNGGILQYRRCYVCAH